MNPRRVLHVDVDAMFVQCAVMEDRERLADEELILVGGRPDGRGVVTSASYGCRAFGVHSAMPMGAALRLCPDAVIVPVPKQMVRTKTREILAVLSDWAPTVAMASVDEAYLDMSGTEILYHQEPLSSTAKRIQSDLKRRTGLHVSIGGGTNRLVAKLATSFAKPQGVHIVQPGAEENFISRLELHDLLGIGPTLLADLRRRGISSMEALRSLDLVVLDGWYGETRGRWLWESCRGIDNSPVRQRESSKSVSSETTFHQDIGDLERLETALLEQVADATRALRLKRLYARTVTVKIRDGAFRDRSRSRTLRESIHTPQAVFAIARQLLRALWDERSVAVRLIGVTLSNLSESGDVVQGTFVDMSPPHESSRDRAIAKAADLLNDRFGASAIRPGRLLSSREEG